MARGNQRDVDRERAKKRADKKAKMSKTDHEKRKFTDAEIMREKQKAAEERKMKAEMDEDEEEKVAAEKPKKKKEKTVVPNYLLGFTGGPGVLKEKKKEQKDKQRKKQKK